MSLGNLRVKSKLTAAFGSLSAIVLVVSALATTALSQGHDC